MQRLRRLAAAVAIVIGASACAGVGVAATSDPATKLHDAVYLYDKEDRPLIAERLIREAIAIYRARSDQAGLADAYLDYGFFFVSRSVAVTWASYYQKQGFLDPTATFANRLRKSDEYFEKAVVLYEAEGRFDAATNASLNMGFALGAMHSTQAACQAFDRSLADWRKNVRQNPTANQVVPDGFASYGDFEAAVKRRYDCRV